MIMHPQALRALPGVFHDLASSIINRVVNLCELCASAGGRFRAWFFSRKAAEHAKFSSRGDLRERAGSLSFAAKTQRDVSDRCRICVDN